MALTDFESNASSCTQGTHRCEIIKRGSIAQKMTFFIKDFFSKCESHLLKKFLMENFILCAGVAMMHVDSTVNMKVPTIFKFEVLNFSAVNKCFLLNLIKITLDYFKSKKYLIVRISPW